MPVADDAVFRELQQHLGFGLATIANDSGLIVKAAREAIRDTREAVGKAKRIGEGTSPTT